MLERIAGLAIRAPRRIVAIAALVMVACGIFGIPVAKSLSAGGFQDPTSESARATQLLVDKFGQGDMELVISLTDDSAAAGAQSPAARAVATDIVTQLQPIAGRRAGDLAVDRTAVGRTGPRQRGRQDRSDRCRHHRRGKWRPEARQGTHRQARTRSRRRDGACRWYGDDLRPDQRAERKRPADDGSDRHSAELHCIGLGVRWTHGRGAATGRRRVRDPRIDGRAPRTHVGHRCVHLRDEPHHRNGVGARHRLHAAHHQQIPRRAGRGRGFRPGTDPHNGDCRSDGAVLGADRGAVDGGDGAVPDVLPQVVRLCGDCRGDLRGRGRHRGGARGDRAAGAPARRAGHPSAGPPAPQSARTSAQAGRADVLVPQHEIRYATVCSRRRRHRRPTSPARRALPWDQVGLPGRPRAAAVCVGARGR